MSLDDREIQAISVLGASLIGGGLFLAVIFLTDVTTDTKSRKDDMVIIEASLAFKTAPQKKQPEKPTSQPEPPKPEEGVSRDDKKPPVEGCKSDAECKPDETCKNHRCEPKKPAPAKPPTTDQVFAAHPHPDDDDQPAGQPTTQPGEFNDSDYGFAPLTSGHPFWQQFARDIRENFSLPEISAANGIPVGCFRIAPDGKIVATQLTSKSESPDLDDAAERALRAVQKLRNESPSPVPTELLRETNRWTCVRFDPKNSAK